MTASMRSGVSWAGLFAGPAAWAVSTQLNYILAPWGCEHHLQLVPVVALLLALIALFSGVLSWRARRGGGADEDGEPRTETFLGTMGAFSAALFTLVIVMQGSAAFVLTGCER